MQFTRGKKVDRAGVIQDFVRSRRITPEGGDWITLRLDPYHDFQRPIAGYPDADNFDTVVSAYNYELNVSKPAGAAGNWDAHVFTLPIVQQAFLNSTSTDGVVVGTAATYSLGLVNVAKGDAGDSLFVDVDPMIAANFSMAPVATFKDTINGVSRVIGMGVEIIDTTAMLYKQGALTSYKMPVCNNTTMQLMYSDAAGNLKATNTYRYINAPPKSVAEAIIYRNSVQWEAKDGAYMVVGQEGVNNPFTQPSRNSFAISRDSNLVGVDNLLVTSNNVGLLGAAPVAASLMIGAVDGQFMNVSQQGVFMSGLHNDATFKVRVRIYLERAPILTSPDLVALATPSAAYDVKALELYSHVVSQIPTCVPVNFNAKGDWWRIIVNALKAVAPVIGTILTPIIGPEAGIIGTAVGALVPKQTIGRRRNGKSAPQKKTK